MKSNVKKIILSSIITLLVSAGFTHAADVLTQHSDTAPMAHSIDSEDIQQQAPCTRYQR